MSVLGAGDEYVNTPGEVQCHPILNPPRKDEGEEKKKIMLMGRKQETGVWGGFEESVSRVSSF